MVAMAAALEHPEPPASVAELADLIHEVVRASLHRIHPTLEEERITMGQFWALHLVSSLSSASVGTVAKHLGVTAPSACANIDQLEAAGLVRRRRSVKDRRAVELSLTPRGRRVEARVWRDVAGLLGRASGRVPPADLTTTVRVFREVGRRLTEPGALGGGAA